MSSKLALTEDQKRAVQATGGRVLLVAPAGSGKTEVLIRRLERVLTESVGEAFRILVVTYTVKAAEELQQRIRASIESEAWRVDCDTLHGFALELLLRYGQAVGVSPNVVTFSDDTDRLALIADYIRTLGLTDKITTDIKGTLGPVLRAIDQHRTMLQETGALQQSFADLGMEFTELYEAYEGALRNGNGIDFPGMLTKATELIDTDMWVLANFHKTYRHIFVDEGQDLTPVQARLLGKLAGPEVDMFVVADDRQSINGFAGGGFANALAVVGREADTLHLEHNFRCSQRVLAAAERVARLINQDPQPTLNVPGAPPGEVLVVPSVDGAEEAEAIVMWIANIVENGLDPATLASGEDPRVNLEDIAVIARARSLLDPVIANLVARGIEVSLNLEPSGFLTAPEGRILFEGLSLVQNPKDRPAQRRLRDELTAFDCDMDLADPLEALIGSTLPELAPVARLISACRSREVDLDTVLGQLGEGGGSGWQGDAGRIESLWRSYRAGTSAQQRSLQGYLRYVSRAQLAKPSDPGVRILTIHRVKGLEFKAVALLGLRDGALPDFRAQTETELDAEKRALYVAMTRASRALRMSWPRFTSDRWGRKHSQNPSRFLREASLVG